MDFLNKTFAQVTDLFRSMTPGARITAGLLLTVLVVSLGYLFNHQSSSPDAFLLGGDPVPATQLPAIESAFAKAKLSGYEIDGNHCIRVPSGQKALYMAALADNNALPRGFGDHLINVYKDMGPFSGQKQQQELVKVAKERELAQIISSMRGIESASVMYDIEAEPGLSVAHAIKTASVSVKPQGNEPLAEERVQMIRQLVAGAIGCKPTDISVADLNTDRTYPGGTNGSAAGGLDNAYGAAKRMYEKQWDEKIREALSFIPGAIITTNVELNPETDSEQHEIKVDPKAVLVDAKEDTHTSNTVSGGVGGRPGLVPQNGVLNQSNSAASLAASSGPKTDVDDKKTHEKSVPSTNELVSHKAGLTPSRVTVTVGVLSTYYEKIWRERNPTPAGAEPKPIDKNAIDQIEAAEKKNIRDYVAQLIPKPQTEAVQEVTPLVTVMTFQHLPSIPLELPTVADKAMFWFSQSWSTLGMIGLGMVSLLVLRSMVRATPATELPRGEAAPLAALQADEEEAPVAKEQQEAAARLKRRAKSGPSLRDELVVIVREDPDSAANILKNWIGSAT